MSRVVALSVILLDVSKLLMDLNFEKNEGGRSREKVVATETVNLFGERRQNLDLKDKTNGATPVGINPIALHRCL